MRLLARYLGLIKFEHTLFALPFALISLLVAAAGRPSRRVLLWVLVAMVAARTAAMAFNRLADRRLDAANPRTSDRHLATGEVSVRGAATLVGVASVAFIGAAGQLNTLCLVLSPVALAIVLGYSFTKRFTALSHLVLGLGLAVAPVGAWLAVTGRFAPFPLWTAAGVMFWVAGFDTIYGCQDATFDRRAGLHSLAARFGVPTALRLSRGFHLLAVVCLTVAFTRPPAIGGDGAVSAPLGAPALAGVVIMAGLLVWEQFLVRDGELRRIRRAFFEINSWIGMVLLAAVVADLYLF